MMGAGKGLYCKNSVGHGLVTDDLRVEKDLSRYLFGLFHCVSQSYLRTILFHNWIILRLGIFQFNLILKSTFCRHPHSHSLHGTLISIVFAKLLMDLINCSAPKTLIVTVWTNLLHHHSPAYTFTNLPTRLITGLLFHELEFSIDRYIWRTMSPSRLQTWTRNYFFKKCNLDSWFQPTFFKYCSALWNQFNFFQVLSHSLIVDPVFRLPVYCLLPLMKSQPAVTLTWL